MSKRPTVVVHTRVVVHSSFHCGFGGYTKSKAFHNEILPPFATVTTSIPYSSMHPFASSVTVLRSSFVASRIEKWFPSCRPWMDGRTTNAAAIIRPRVRLEGHLVYSFLSCSCFQRLVLLLFSLLKKCSDEWCVSHFPPITSYELARPIFMEWWTSKRDLFKY